MNICRKELIRSNNKAICNHCQEMGHNNNLQWIMSVENVLPDVISLIYKIQSETIAAKLGRMSITLPCLSR